MYTLIKTLIDTPFDTHSKPQSTPSSRPLSTPSSTPTPSPHLTMIRALSVFLLEIRMPHSHLVLRSKSFFWFRDLHSSSAFCILPQFTCLFFARASSCRTMFLLLLPWLLHRLTFAFSVSLPHLRHLSSLLSYLVLVIVLAWPSFTHIPLSHSLAPTFRMTLALPSCSFSPLARLPRHRACHRPHRLLLSTCPSLAPPHLLTLALQSFLSLPLVHFFSGFLPLRDCRLALLYSHCFGCHYCTCLFIHGAYSHQTPLLALLHTTSLLGKNCSSQPSPLLTLFHAHCPSCASNPRMLHRSSFAVHLSLVLALPFFYTSSMASVEAPFCASFGVPPLRRETGVQIVLDLARHRLNLCKCADARASPSIAGAPARRLCPPLFACRSSRSSTLPVSLRVARSSPSAYPGPHSTAIRDCGTYHVVGPFPAASDGPICGAARGFSRRRTGLLRAPARGFTTRVGTVRDGRFRFAHASHDPPHPNLNPDLSPDLKPNLNALICI